MTENAGGPYCRGKCSFVKIETCVRIVAFINVDILSNFQYTSDFFICGCSLVFSSDFYPSKFTFLKKSFYPFVREIYIFNTFFMDIFFILPSAFSRCDDNSVRVCDIYNYSHHCILIKLIKKYYLEVILHYFIPFI